MTTDSSRDEEGDFIDKVQTEIERERCGASIRTYLNKFRGLREERPKRLAASEYLWSFIGAILGIGSVALVHYRVVER